MEVPITKEELWEIIKLMEHSPEHRHIWSKLWPYYMNDLREED